MKKSEDAQENHASTTNTHNIEQSKQLADAAQAVLEKNDRGQYTAPASNLYPHQWLWDSCFIAIGIKHYDIDRAKQEILSILEGQWTNGMVPHMIFNGEPKYRRDRNAWRSWINPHAPDDIATSGITQPPVLTEAVQRIGAAMELTERRAWYKLVWPSLLAYHEWLYYERDPHAEGLTLQVHPWETGLDNTPPWMHELHEHILPWWVRGLQITKLDGLARFIRRDTRFVPVNQRFDNVEAMTLFNVQHRLRRKSYNTNKVLNHSLFTVEDLSFNCILIRANAILQEIAKSIRAEIPDELSKRFKKSEKALEELWEPYAQEYFSRDFITHKLLKHSSVAALMPLYSGAISKERADILVKKLENEHLFGTSYPVPSVPTNSPDFDENRYWQGPSWVNMNWLIIDGLHRYGYHDHAQALRESTLEMVSQGGFYEYFHPTTGAPLGVPDFSWTAALTIDLLHKK